MKLGGEKKMNKDQYNESLDSSMSVNIFFSVFSLTKWYKSMSHKVH